MEIDGLELREPKHLGYDHLLAIVVKDHGNDTCWDIKEIRNEFKRRTLLLLDHWEKTKQ